MKNTRKNKRIPCLTALTLLVSIISFVPSYAGETVWVTAQGTAAIVDGRTDEAKIRAGEDAVKQAVYEAIGKTITAENLQVSLKLSGSILGAIPYGRITKKKIIEEGKIRLPVKGQQSPAAAYRVKIEAAVTEETEGFNPDFRLDAVLNQKSFKSGSEMQIKIIPAGDCTIYIFNLLEDEKILRLIPNKLTSRNELQTGKIYYFPDETDRKAGIHLIAHLPKGKKAVLEAFYLLALKKPFKFDSKNIQEGIFGEYNGRAAFMNDLIKEITCIPFSKRAEKLIPYQIVKQ